MYSSKSFAFFSLSVILLLHAALCADPLFHFCFSTDRYTADSPYKSNLNNLINFLSTKAPPTGFGIGSFGQYENRVNGLALCRGDVSSSNCATCIAEGAKELQGRCHFKKGAIIWYDYCEFKYSNEDFLGSIDTRNRFYMYNVQSVNDLASFNEKTKDLLNRLANEAYVSPQLYATGEQELKEYHEKLYGLVQCTRDLSKDDCKKCLDGAISEIPSCCDGKRGGRVVGGSCNFRYELYPFVNV